MIERVDFYSDEEFQRARAAEEQAYQRRFEEWAAFLEESYSSLLDAAPEMYEALKQQRRQLLLIAENCEGFANSVCGYSIELIDVALAKAEGLDE